MARITVERSCSVRRSFRVEQVAGLFDLKVAARSSREWEVELPEIGDEWKIGAIVGPSGSGKTVIGKAAYGRSFTTGYKWPAGDSVLDGFNKSLEANLITSTLTSVGFSSPPDWVKPYGVLSNGQRFRCDLARALLTRSSVIAFDEFTSVVDRQVAQFGSAAVAKTIRRGRVAGFAERFVAVTCHYDILDWLEPDWVLDLGAGASGRLARRWVQRERARFKAAVGKRPPIRIDIARCRAALWGLFAHHHYLSSDLNKAAQCFVALIAGRPVGFCAALPMVGRLGAAGVWRLSRSVVLPDWQGMGVGIAMGQAVSSIFKARGKKMRAITRHPAIIRHHEGSPFWELKHVDSCAPRRTGVMEGCAGAAGRALVSFEYVGP